jgi:TATA-box binding protein (TBP) (component of TFIID and TFIIIB)
MSHVEARTSALTISTQTVIAVIRDATIECLKDAFDSLVIDDVLVCAKHGDSIRQCASITRQGKRKTKLGFRNAVTLVLKCCGKYVNVKIARSCKMQITGCKGLDHAEAAAKITYAYLQPKIVCVQPVHITAWPVMTNFDFKLGYEISRRRVDTLLHRHNVLSMVESSFGYPGVITKCPVEPNAKIEAREFTYTHQQQWVSTHTFIDAPVKKYTTFMFFQSGSVIVSGISEHTVRGHIEYVLNILRTNEAFIRVGMIQDISLQRTKAQTIS